MARSWKMTGMFAAGALAVLAMALAPASASAWECQVKLEKKVALDADCNGQADDAGGFVDSLSPDVDECVVYRFCVTNSSGGQPQDLSDVLVSDEKLGLVDLDFGTVAVGATECKYFPAVESSDSLVCREIEGTNTAKVTSAVCAVDKDKACDRSGSVCEDSANVECNRGEGCLTRTPGFWGNHPDVTANFLPVTSCGRSLDDTLAGAAGSVTEDLCSLGRDKNVYASNQQAQLVRQCAAAALNLVASEDLGGSCGESATALFDRCCTSCDTVGAGCIDDLDAFNNSRDTLLGESGGEISLCKAGPPCNAEPGQCKLARDNGVINPVP